MPIGTGLTTKYFSWDAIYHHSALDYGYFQQNPTVGTMDLWVSLSYFHLSIPKSNGLFRFSFFTQRVFVILYLNYGSLDNMCSLYCSLILWAASSKSWIIFFFSCTNILLQVPITSLYFLYWIILGFLRRMFFPMPYRVVFWAFAIYTWASSKFLHFTLMELISTKAEHTWILKQLWWIFNGNF